MEKVKNKICSRGHRFNKNAYSTCPICWPGRYKKQTSRSYKVKAEIRLYPGMVGWHFVTIPKKQSDEIKKNFVARKRGWGSLPVTATLGKTKWNTSIFPDKKSASYLLPLKSDVRKKEGLRAGNAITFLIEVR